MTSQDRNESSLVPHDKFDVDIARRLLAADTDDVQRVLPELVAWCADGNWPVAKTLAPFLAKVNPPVTKHLIGVLQGIDSCWKYYVLQDIVSELPITELSKLTSVLADLADNPSQSDRAEEVDELAREQLERLLE